MEGICIGKGMVIGNKFIFGLVGYKTRGSCVYNKTAEKHFRWYVLRRIIAIHSHPSKQQITNLIKYGVATGITPAYNTTKTPNKLLSHQFICNVPYNKTAETSLFFCSFIVHTTAPCFVSR